MYKIERDDAPLVIQQKIGEATERLLAGEPTDTRRQAIRVFETLLAEGETFAVEDESEMLQGKMFKQQLFESMHQVLGKWASETRGVVVFDDLHWADPASVELLLHLIGLVDDTPIVFLCAFRPDQEAAAQQVRSRAEDELSNNFIIIELAVLSDEESGWLTENLLEMDDVPVWLHDEMLLKSEGNPLYVEEMIRTLIDSGALLRDASNGRWQVAEDFSASEISMPDTLQSLLVARIDRLDEGARRTLQFAAVIGKRFSYGVLQAISEMSNLDMHLGTLRSRGMLEQRGDEHKREYAFQHLLIQEAAYNSILIKQRRVYHARVGAALEDEVGLRVEENAPLLAFHYYEAGDSIKALKYYMLAGDSAARLYANLEAATHYGRAVEAAKMIDGDAVETEQLLHVYGGLGRALSRTNHYDAALEAYEDMEAFAHKRDDRVLELEALMARATLRSTPTPVYDTELGSRLAEQTLALAQELGNRQAESKVLWNLLLLHTYAGNVEDAVKFGERSLALARELQLMEQLAFTLNDLHRAYTAVPDMGKTIAVLDEARELWRELGNKAMLADNLNGSANIYFLIGEYDRAVAASEEGYLVSKEIKSRWGQGHSRLSLGRVYFERGQPGKALATMEESGRVGEEAGLSMIISAVRAELAWMYASMGALEESRAASSPSSV